MKVAIFEVSHWHFPLYRDALLRADVDVVAVSDREESFRSSVSNDFNAKAYADWRDLVTTENFEFAFVFGRHIDMPEIGKALMERRIPFAMEKPCGVNVEGIRGLRDRAVKENLFAAVPFTMRLSPLVSLLREAEERLPLDATYFSFRQLSGPPSRYLENGSPWLLDPVIAGGGCAINLAIHYIDLVLHLTGSEVITVSGLVSNLNHAAPVEDYARITLDMENGASAVIETGYCFPTTDTEKREFNFSIGTKRNHFRSTSTGARLYPRMDHVCRNVPMNLDQDPLYDCFVTTVLDDFREGTSPLASLSDAHRAMSVIDAVYSSNTLDSMIVSQG